MAEALRKFEFDVLERNWLRKALENQRAVLMRAIARELPESEVRAFRQREIEAINKLLAKF